MMGGAASEPSCLQRRRSLRTAAGAVLLVALMWVITWISVGRQVGKPFPGFFYNPERVFSGFTPPSFSGWQAGLRPWDQVVAVNGQHWREIPRLVAEAGVGGVLVYTVERDGQSLDFAVPTMAFTQEMLLLFLPSYLALSVVFLAVGVFVYLRHPAGALNRYLLAYLLIWALGGSIIWESYLSQQKVLAYWLALYAIAAPVAGWMFLWSFPADPTRRRFLSRWPVVRVFLVVGVTASMFMVSLHVLASVTDRPELWRLMAFVTGWPYFIAFGLASIPLKTVPLVLIAARPGEGRVRQQALVMLVGLVLGLIGWYLFVWAPAAIHVAPIAWVPWAGLVPILYPLALGYAILRYRLLDIRVVVRKGLIYSLLTAMLTAAFLLLSLLAGILYRELTGQQSLWVMTIPALAVAFLFEPARRRIQAFVDKAFFRREYEMRQELTRFSRELSTLRERGEVVELLQSTVTRTLGARAVCLWLPLRGSFAPVELCNGPAAILSAGGPLALSLTRTRRAFLLVPDDLSPAAQELRRVNAALAVPLVTGESLVGVLTLDERRSGAAYGQEDLELLDMLAPSAALALENARLYQGRIEMLGQQVTRVVAAQEEERGRIARELHDGVGPSLASLGLRLHTVRKGLERRGDPAAAEVGELEEQAQANIRDVRRVINDLRPAALDGLGLVPALQEYVERCQGEREIDVVLVVTDGVPDLPAPVETALYRITQEALANVYRHAGASRVEVRLARENGDVILEVADDGQGFDPSAPLPGIHVGLWSMRQRAEQFGGRFNVRSAPGQGTSVAVTVSLDRIE